MMRPVLTTATLTGVFCVAFALVVGEVGMLLGAVPVALASFASGFLGSLFAQTVVRGWRERKKMRPWERSQ